MKKYLSVLLLLCMMLTLCACGSTGEKAPAEPAGPAIEEIVVGTTAVIEKAVNGEYNYDMLSSGTTQLPLVYQDTDGKFHPLLASFETKDSITWTYTIVDGMKWSDGEDVTAEDILFTLQYEDANGSANLTEQKNEEGKVTKAKYAGYKLSEDGRSISLTLASANVRELGNMTSFRVQPKHILEGNTTPTEENLRLGCGPYVFESFSKESGTISFVVNPNYPQQPNVARIVYRLFDNEDTMFLALQQGDIDMVWAYSTGIAGNYQEVLSKAENVNLISVSAQNLPTALVFNNEKGPFADENACKAVSYALDYEQFRTYVGSASAAIPNRGFVPPTTIGYKETEAQKTDEAKADEYMNEAGYTKNEDGKFVDDNGNVFSFTLTYRADKNNQVSCAELIKTMLDKFGMEVTLESLDTDSYNAKTSNKFSEKNITMEAMLYGYTSAGMGMGNGLATIYIDGNHAVQGGGQVFDEGFQTILSAMAKSATLEEYIKAAGDMQDYYAEHSPVIALYWDSFTYGISSKFENVTVDNVFGLNNVNNWLTITAKS